MAAGDFYIRKNSNDTSSVPNAGTDLDSNWDFVVADEGGIVTYSNPNFQLDTGLYLIMYSEHFYTSNNTNNERIEIQGEIHISGTGAVGGYGSDYIRKGATQFDCVVSGYMFLQVTSDNTDVFVKFYRTDDSTTGTVYRIPGYGSVQIIEMDDTNHNFAFYSTSSSESTAGTTVRTLNIDTDDKQDTGFSRSSNIVTISNAGRYVMTYNLDISTTSTGRENVRAWISKNGTTTKVVGSQSHSYIRGIDGCQDSALAWIGIVDVAANDTFQIRWDVPTSATVTAAAGAKFQIWQIPTSADECIMEATTGDYNADANFEWDTVPHIDTASFTASTNSTKINVDQVCHLLSFTTFSQTTDSAVARAYPFVRFRKNGNVLDYATGGGYQRNSGTYGFAVTNASIVPTIETYLEVYTRPFATIGALANISGQFAVLNLESIWSYTYPPLISGTTQRQIDIGDENIQLYGKRFLSSQGTGKVELGDSVNYLTATKVTQTVDTWSDTQIQFDLVQGSLSQGYVYLYVTNSNGKVSEPYRIALGQVPYYDAVTVLSPDHYWTLQNKYDDDGDSIFDRPMVSEVGSPSFVTGITISRSDSYSLYFDDVLIRNNIADVADMNSLVSRERTMGGWIQLGGIQKSLGAIYKEGANVNNFAFLIGFGNVLMAQMADTGDDNAQAYSDFNLTPNRPYHIMFRMSYIETPKEFRLYIDGIEQSVTDGNPLTSIDMDSHVGNVNWGDPDGNLEMGGTDIAFEGQEDIYFSQWYTWSRALNETEIREYLFELGAKPQHIISGTTSVMQNMLDNFSDTEQGDVPLAFNIHQATDSKNFELIADNITFNDRCSINVQFMGTGTLTWTNINGSSIDTDKISTPNGGTVTIYNPPYLTISNLKENSEVRVYESGTTTEVAGVELTGGTFITNIFVDYVDVQVVSIGYVIQRFEKVDMTGGDVEIPMDQPLDRVYNNP